MRRVPAKRGWAVLYKNYAAYYKHNDDGTIEQVGTESYGNRPAFVVAEELIRKCGDVATKRSMSPLNNVHPKD